MELYFIRHGETAYNKEKRYTGHSDIPLNDTGVEQILRLKKQLEMLKPDFIYTSDLKRAVQTTELLNFKTIPHQAKALRELNYGIAEGMTYSEFKHKYPQVEKKWYANWSAFLFPEGESYLAMCNRVISFIDEKVLKEQAETGIIITHGGCICAILSYYLTGDFTNFWKFKIDNGSFARLSLVDDYIYLNI